MLTRLVIRNFKRFDEVEIELGNPVVFIGPNNSGKTSALQALALWDIGVKKWLERRGDRSAAEKRPGVTINRRDLVALPVPDANLLWRDLRVRFVVRKEGGQARETHNIRIEIVVDGITDDEAWRCGLEFDYANEESLYCRPLRLDQGGKPERMRVPPQAGRVRLAYLPPMSGLAAEEYRMDPGEINVRIGEGRTADVLRNLCYRIRYPVNGPEPGASQAKGASQWQQLVEEIRSLFGVQLLEPEYIPERGQLILRYKERTGATLDISSAGRGLQQTLLLLAYMYANPGAVLLLDEPDAHLEILRQRQIYQLLTDVAARNGNQIIAATHSEVVLNEAAGRDLVIAFVGRPHRLNDRGSQVLKALASIGFEHYYLAEQKRWVLYLEGSTDLAILRSLAERMGHPAAKFLERPFVHYVANQPRKAQEHLYGLREAVQDLRGIAIYDRLDVAPPDDPHLRHLTWRQQELENYLLFPEVLRAYARADQPDDLFGMAEADRREAIMEQCLQDLVPPVAYRNRDDRWWSDVKASEFLDRLFEEYFKRLGLPNVMRKTDYHRLARFVPADLIAPEVREKLDAIVEVATAAEAHAASMGGEADAGTGRS